MKRIYQDIHRALPALFLAMAALQGAEAQAQNAVFDLRWYDGVPQVTGDNNISLEYKWYVQGADIESRYSLVITSASKSISRVEFEGVYNSQKNLGPVLVGEGGGTLDFHPMGTSVWQGSAKVLSFIGQSNTDYIISTLRIWYGMEACEPPTISAGGGRINFGHELPDAVIHYTIAPNGTNNSGLTTTGSVPLSNFVVSAKAEAEDHAPSAQKETTLTYASVKARKGDVDGNKIIDLNDIKALVQFILSRK